MNDAEKRRIRERLREIRLATGEYVLRDARSPVMRVIGGHLYMFDAVANRRHLAL